MAVENPTSSSSASAPSKSAMPPGMVMGPDGKPCKICTAFRNWSPRTTNHTEAVPDYNKRKGHTPTTSPSKASGGNSAAAMMAAFATGGTMSTAQATVAAPERTLEPPPDCPPDVEQLGRATWTFLHTTAAYYPEKPTPTQRVNMLSLIRSLPMLYPCTSCATDFGEDVSKNPPDVSSRERLSKWLCERHNEVNQKLGKEKFDCVKVDERWRDGPPDGRCD
ncbi:ERV/ALR sulfhydryl oxidase domain-containing protein [Crucibulum laeve]|uniref:Sulfhydryl oxidase n=1 Tax=Crucibulum laeve TaxID=68775 RepID=A0A5C3M3Z0_9AGAR|nr:ERV/ALR sulfhydryl oxidase domain-containing protein [Crucibulum laeve]